MIYEYRCKTCNKDVEILLPVEKYTETQICYDCNKPMIKLMPYLARTSPATIMGYYDVQLDTYIESKQHHKKVLKERNLVEVGTYKTMKAENAHRARRKEEVAKAKREGVIKESIEKLVAAQ